MMSLTALQFSVVVNLLTGVHSACVHETVEPFLPGKIAGGQDVVFGRYPYMCSLRSEPGHRGSSHFCGGVLIHKDWVLTAAHCLVDEYGAEKTKFYISCGLIHSDDSEAEEFTSCHVIYHDQYDFTTPHRGNDIALVKLSKSCGEQPCKIEDRDMVQLKHNGRSNVRAVRTMGWGLNEDKKSLKILQQVDLDLMRPLTCAKKFKGLDFSLMSRFINRKKTICGHKDGADACRGDSGGPLIIPGDEKECGHDDVLIGITSFGLPCGGSDMDAPGVFTRALGFKKWIDERGLGQCQLKSNFECRRPLDADLIVSCGQRLEDYFAFTKRVECETVPMKPKEAGGCAFFKGIDLGKGALTVQDRKKYIFDTPEECCALCKRTKRCKTWTYIHVAEKDFPKGSCFMREVLAPATRCSTCTSGLKISEEETDYHTSDGFSNFLGVTFEGRKVGRKSYVFRPEECRENCRKKSYCDAVEFRATNFGGICTYMKNPSVFKICNKCQSLLKATADLEDLGDDVYEVMFRNPVDDLSKALQKGNCQYTVGVDMIDDKDGALMDENDEIHAGTPEECCKYCREKRGCVAWTLLITRTFHYEMFGKVFKRDVGRCYLRNKVLAEVPCSVCVSGVVAESGTSCFKDPSCTLLEGIDLPGYDLETLLEIASPMKCCDECKKRKECKAWTRNRVSRTCWLKRRGGPVPVRCASCDSGVMIEKVTHEEILPLHPVVTKND